MSAHPSSTARRPFAAARRLVARICSGLLALAGCLLLAGLPFAGPAPAHRPPTAATLLAEPMAAGKAPAPRTQAADQALELVEAGDAFPLSAVVHLVITFPDGAHVSGSGSLVDRFHVLTAGHCVYSSRHGGWAKEVSVFAGQTGSKKPFEVAHSVKAHTFNSFIDDDKASEDGRHSAGDGDIGMITLDRMLGDETGWFTFGYNDDSDFDGWTPFKAGYPGKPYSGNDLYISHGPILGAHPGKSSSFGYFEWDVRAMAALPGQSGSGLYEKDEDTGNLTIYAVHDLGNAERGYAERITKDVFDAIQGWIAEDGQPDAPDGPDEGDNP